jgi:hypothetical protein
MGGEELYLPVLGYCGFPDGLVLMLGWASLLGGFGYSVCDHSCHDIVSCAEIVVDV